MYVKARETCRVCGSSKLTTILSLGDQFVTNFVEESMKESVELQVVEEKASLKQWVIAACFVGIFVILIFYTYYFY